jgi:Holliday junction DNA helicase RuvA
MITTLRGTLATKAPTEIVVEIQGIGYALSIPLSTYERIGDPGSTVFLYTHEHVREDAHQLFGFATEEERGMFRLLLSVNGIGPKMAQGILSGIPVPELRAHLSGGNRQALIAIPGIGRKLADRLILELREKLGRTETPAAPGEDGELPARVRSEALLALLSLGYARPAAEKALRAALLQPGSGSASVEQLIKQALRSTAAP